MSVVITWVCTARKWKIWCRWLRNVLPVLDRSCRAVRHWQVFEQTSLFLKSLWFLLGTLGLSSGISSSTRNHWGRRPVFSTSWLTWPVIWFWSIIPSWCQRWIWDLTLIHRCSRLFIVGWSSICRSYSGLYQHICWSWLLLIDLWSLRQRCKSEDAVPVDLLSLQSSFSRFSGSCFICMPSSTSIFSSWTLSFRSVALRLVVTQVLSRTTPWLSVPFSRHVFWQCSPWKLLRTCDRWDSIPTVFGAANATWSSFFSFKFSSIWSPTHPCWAYRSIWRSPRVPRNRSINSNRKDSSATWWDIWISCTWHCVPWSTWFRRTFERNRNNYWTRYGLNEHVPTTFNQCVSWCIINSMLSLTISFPE